MGTEPWRAAWSDAWRPWPAPPGSRPHPRSRCTIAPVWPLAPAGSGVPLPLDRGEADDTRCGAVRVGAYSCATSRLGHGRIACEVPDHDLADELIRGIPQGWAGRVRGATRAQQPVIVHLVHHDGVAGSLGMPVNAHGPREDRIVGR